MSVIRADVGRVVREFRARLDSADHAALEAPWRDFPKGSCGAASEVLAEVLRRRFGIETTYILSAPPEQDAISHGWLEWDGFTIDVTADQFGQPPVVFAERSPWHEALPHVSRQPCSRDTQWLAVHAGRAWAVVADLADLPAFN